ncbi:hypothetical protein BATDEDRAFT_27890 [Batrachochytrium dendrobatidis JAM81]|uniref:B30.2/SPRY domain-containing protein n=2 Tax=Batrachochytrium dendrobatidis TaxID=109871 RepID=F4PBZ8_BATDJ|nr:uncharacterized protein BATDEDRAFT_27890 [Batrachochytrium dendrobatidis JAM81]EGF77219.1 hypothetical protein BATDEDRAFT_27890 [Batrachochytrium dendrobatidis JAM81]|eukprot:XP_006682183.1 hypothetical protein BATDEDRAFT_27890 [Batrachochytrium dendrobatidis JAM81]
MSQIEQNVLAFTTGLALTLTVYTIWTSFQETTFISHSSESKKRISSKPEDTLSLEALAELSRSGNLLLQDSLLSQCSSASITAAEFNIIYSASQILLDRAMSEENRPVLIRMKALKILVRSLNFQTNDDTRRYAISAIFSLITNDERSKHKIVQYGVLGPLTHFLSATPKLNSDLKYWALLLLHQISISEDMHFIMVKHNVIELLARVARLIFGNTSMQKLCLHSLVRLVSSLPAEEAPAQLSILIEMKMIHIIAACLRHDIAKDRILAINGLFKTFSMCLANNETVIARITLRIIKCLCSENIKFQRDLVRAKLLPPMIAALESKDSEAQYWAMAVMHELTSKSEIHKTFLDCGGLDTLTHAAKAAPHHVLLYIADMLVYLCGNASNQTRLANSKMVDLIISFCHSTDSEIQYAGAALMLNAATLSNQLCQQIAELNGIEILDSYLNSNYILSNQLVAVKALLTIAVKDPSLRFQITVFTVRPLVQRLPLKVAECLELAFPNLAINSNQSSANDEHSSNFDSPLMSYMPELVTFGGASVPSSPQKRRAGTVSRFSISPDCSNSRKTLQSCKSVQHLLSCLFVLLNTSVFDEVDLLKNEQTLEEYMADCFDETCGALLDLLALVLLDYAFPETVLPFLAPASAYMLDRQQRNIAIHYVMSIMIREKLVAILIGLLEIENKTLSYQAFITLALCVSRGLPVQEIVNIHMAFPTVLKFVIAEASQTLYFYMNILLENLCRFDTFLKTDSLAPFDILNSVYTSGFSMAIQTQEIRNDDWTFQSLRMNTGVTGNGRYAYEFVIRTTGIIQIGWACDKCVFDPEAGTGVGDNVYSYAFDGHRVKKWHDSIDDNEYGAEWTAGDVITAILDLDQKTITFCLNGVSFGVAFTNVDNSVTWCPAVSLTSEQSGFFRFGSKFDPLKFLPEHTVPIASVSSDTLIMERSIGSPKENRHVFEPPPHVHTESVTSRDRVVTEAESVLTENNVALTPLFYFEARVNISMARVDKCPQFGILLREDQMVIVCLERHSKTLIWLKIHGLHYNDKSIFDYMLDQHLVSMMDASQETSQSFSSGIEIIHLMPNIDWQVYFIVIIMVQDAVGIKYVICMCCKYPIFNTSGPTLALEETHDAICIPYMRHIPKFVLNIGETPFMWLPAHPDRTPNE